MLLGLSCVRVRARSTTRLAPRDTCMAARKHGSGCSPSGAAARRRGGRHGSGSKSSARASSEGCARTSVAWLAPGAARRGAARHDTTARWRSDTREERRRRGEIEGVSHRQLYAVLFVHRPMCNLTRPVAVVAPLASRASLSRVVHLGTHRASRSINWSNRGESSIGSVD